MAQLVKTVNGLAIASVKTVSGLAIASVKTVNGLDNTSAGTTYEFTDKFEGSQTDATYGLAGFDNTGWDSTSGTSTAHYATAPAPLANTYSWRNSAFAQIKHDFTTAASKVRLYFMINIFSGVSNGDTIAEIYDASNNLLCNLNWRTSGALRCVVGGTQGTSSSTGVANAGSTVHIWLEYTNGGSGADKLDCFAAASATKPSTTCTLTSGTSAANGAKFRIGGTTAGDIVDNCVADGTQDIGSNPVT